MISNNASSFSYQEFWDDGSNEIEDLPASPALKIARKNDIFADMDDEEIADLQEFIRVELLKDYEPILQLPKQEVEFFLPKELDEFGKDVSAFNTYDFQRKMPEFDKAGYRDEKLLERAKDLAQLYSAITGKADKEAQHERFLAFLNFNCRSSALKLAEFYSKARDEGKKAKLKEQIAKINRQVIKLNAVWQEFSQ